MCTVFDNLIDKQIVGEHYWQERLIFELIICLSEFFVYWK